jgi:hypothetical protein
MQALWLDYQRPYPGRRRVGLGLLVASVVVAGLMLNQYFAMVAERDELHAQVLLLKREAVRGRLLVASGGGSTQLPSSPQKGRVDSATVSRSAAQWESLFAALEAASDDSVTLLALQPGVSEITISGEAKNLAASMDYVKRLQSATAFAKVHLTQSEIVMEHPQHPVRFTLAADWRKAS